MIIYGNCVWTELPKAGDQHYNSVMTNDSFSKSFSSREVKIDGKQIKASNFLSLKITYNYGNQPSRKNETADINSPPDYFSLPPQWPPPANISDNLLSACSEHRQNLLSLDTKECKK